jgi:hypothetical protein
MKILKMIDDGKISAEEGARLLAALGKVAPNAKPRPPVNKPGGGPRWLRVRVTDTITGKPKATVNLPIGLVEAGLNIASQYAPQVAFDELMAAIQAGAEGKIVDVFDEEDGERVEIFVE